MSERTTLRRLFANVFIPSIVIVVGPLPQPDNIWSKSGFSSDGWKTVSHKRSSSLKYTGTNTSFVIRRRRNGMFASRPPNPPPPPPPLFGGFNIMKSVGLPLLFVVVV